MSFRLQSYICNQNIPSLSDIFLSLYLVIMSSGDKSKTSSQTDGKAAQGKKSEIGMMSYKVGSSHCGSGLSCVEDLLIKLIMKY